LRERPACAGGLANDRVPHGDQTMTFSVQGLVDGAQGSPRGLSSKIAMNEPVRAIARASLFGWFTTARRVVGVAAVMGVVGVLTFGASVARADEPAKESKPAAPAPAVPSAPTVPAAPATPPTPVKPGEKPTDKKDEKGGSGKVESAATNDQSGGGVLDQAMKTLEGEDANLAQYKGKVVLFVNVASQCGYTPQYKGLQAVHEKYKDRGLVVIGVPSNDFGNQEPGIPAEIRDFCSTNYSVSFPLTEKVSVKGATRHALYAKLAESMIKPTSDPKAAAVKAGEPKWNFTKYLVGRDGKTAARFDSRVDPTSAEMTKAIESLLAEKADNSAKAPSEKK